MNDAPSLNTQAILLLTAPLVLGREKRFAPKPLAAGEYNRLARRLRELLKKRLREQAPPVLYGCGDRDDLDRGRLAVVGSRNVDDSLVACTEGVGRLAAEARRTLVSGGARGIDQAAMRGAMDAGGTVACVLADGLERAATRREHRDAVMDGRLVLICPYDPAAGFLVGHAMQRNKLIYALSDAALVVSAEFEKGGTWAGAVEQLDRHRFVSVYVRATGEMGRGLDALLARGARRWPNPEDPATLGSLLDTPPEAAPASGLASLPREVRSDQAPADDTRPTQAPAPTRVAKPGLGDGLSPAEKHATGTARSTPLFPASGSGER